ncbi:MAG: tetratricopeptide repeat protein [Bacteroidia bacterium]|nr:tetratricopeptide repeat protein [Bacteroidia bacterium]
MKNLTILSLFVFTFNFTWAQKAKVQTAYSYMKAEEFDKAKEAIDEASVNEASAVMPKCWYYRGLIYQSLYKNRKYGALAEDPLGEAYKSFSKALELDPKYEYKDEIKAALMSINANMFNEGLTAFNAKDFNKAYKSFDSLLKLNPNDTSVLINTALAADRSGNNEKAIELYEKIVAMNYKDVAIYTSLIHKYKETGKNDKANALLKAARQAFPADNNLMIEELNNVLGSGDDKKAAEMLASAIQQDPKNASLYFAAGTVYDKLANPRDAKGVELPKPTNFDELVNKSADYYKGAISNNPEYFDANYNLGALYFNQGAELANRANQLPLSKQKEVDALNKQAAEKLKMAEPYLEKALQINPTDESTLQSLKQLYVRTGSTEKYEAIKKQLEKK